LVIPLRRRGPVSNGWWSVAVVLAGIAIIPLGWRAVNAFLPSASLRPSFIPSIESPRERQPFDQQVVEQLQEWRPEYVVIGDSMAGSRVNPRTLTHLVGGRGVAALLHPGTGSAYWYLAFKNWVVRAGLKPKAVIFFFRDENLTAPMWRVYPGSLDRVAKNKESVLDRVLSADMNGPFYRVHLGVQNVYQINRTRDWLEPRITNAPLRAILNAGARETFLKEMNDKLFPLEALRPLVAADMPMATETALDFPARLPRSVLPEILQLAKITGIRPAFIRVQRRPGPNGPPEESEALRRYTASLAEYLRANGAYYHDDWGDPEQPLSIYNDGDHIGRQYLESNTQLFFRRNRSLFQ
jgi:hypothetical protein